MRRVLHCLAQTSFCFIAPVFGVETQKDRSIGDSFISLQNKDFVGRSNIINLSQKLLMRPEINFAVLQHRPDLILVPRYLRFIGRVGCIDKGKLSVHVHIGTNLNGVVDKIQDVLGNFRKPLSGFDRLDTWRDL